MSEGGREGVREGRREGGSEGGREGVREGEREGGREGGRVGNMQVIYLKGFSFLIYIYHDHGINVPVIVSEYICVFEHGVNYSSHALLNKRDRHVKGKRKLNKIKF